MKGAIAAGHPLTADAGARVLEAGGGAVDACVAAALVSWVCESPLTGPGGGGFMLVHEARSGRTGVLDFFVAVPREAAAGELLELAVDFDGDTQQLFRTGAAAVAVPGTALGLEAAHRRFGRVPWRELVEPAALLAAEGFEVTPTQGYLHALLDPLLRHSPEGDAMYGAERDREGDGSAGSSARRRVRARALSRRPSEERVERNHAHLRGGRSRGRRLAQCVARLRLRRGRPGHRNPPEQHARRARSHRR